VVDLMRDAPGPPPLSSVVVSRTSGERAVMSRNSAGRVVSIADVGEPRLRALLADADVVMVDGHQMAMAQWLARNKGSTPLVVDAGSWKPGFDAVIAAADFVIASANFQPPGCGDEAQVIAWLRRQGAANVAISHGEGPIVYVAEAGSGELMMEPVAVVDTLGAGDFLHGAFCCYCLQQPFADALARAAAVARRSCTSFGSRAWLSADSGIPNADR
jgi:sugar/nucleoside kinase (ribokinase family)